MSPKGSCLYKLRRHPKHNFAALERRNDHASPAVITLGGDYKNWRDAELRVIGIEARERCATQYLRRRLRYALGQTRFMAGSATAYCCDGCVDESVATSLRHSIKILQAGLSSFPSCTVNPTGPMLPAALLSRICKSPTSTNC